MAQHPNVGLVRRGYEAFSRGDLGTLAELFAQDIQWHEAGSGFALAGDYKGQEAVFTLFGRLIELTGGEFAIRLEECIADDRQAVAIHSVSARNGMRTYTAREAVVFHLLEGRVTDAWHTVPDVEAFDAFWSGTDMPAAHPNIALVRQGYQAFAMSDVATMSERIAEDVVWHSGVTGSPLDGDYVGRDAVFEMFARLMHETGGTFKIEVVDILANDERATVVCRTTAMRNGTELTLDQVHVHRLEEGRTVEFWMTTTDPARAVAFWGEPGP